MAGGCPGSTVRVGPPPTWRGGAGRAAGRRGRTGNAPRARPGVGRAAWRSRTLSPRRVAVLLEQPRGFRRARSRAEEPAGAEAAPAPRRSLCPPPPPARAGRPSPGRLVKPLVFAVGVMRAGRGGLRGRPWGPLGAEAARAALTGRAPQFTGCAFGSAAIWQYEALKSRVQSYLEGARADWMDKIRPQKRGDLRKQVNRWWSSLTEGQRTVTGLC
uniref:Uncharacterized protein n=1 Tax=Nothoprocta perdicaria TaxID=30464 RepID=A0A8C6YSK3_NOTPE